MHVEFTGKYECQALGINFGATVDGNSIVCSISREALRDIDPSKGDCTAEQQFLAHRAHIECIAEAKLLTGAKSPVAITSGDLQPSDGRA